MKPVQRHTAALLALLSLAVPALAQVVERPLADGWVVALPADARQDDEQEGVRSFEAIVDQGQGRMARLSAWHSRSAGLPWSTDVAARELRRRVDEAHEQLKKLGEVRVHGVERCDRGGAVGLETRVSIRAASGVTYRFRSRFFYSYGRFYSAAYAAAEAHYSPPHAQAFLDSLRDLDEEARATRGVDGRSLAGRSTEPASRR